MSIGSTIKKLRREKDLTQEELASFLNISAQAVSQWECDKSSPDISQIPILVNIFDVSADVLLEIDHSKAEQELKDFFAEYSRLCSIGENQMHFDLT